jgi:hypothetical protein
MQQIEKLSHGETSILGREGSGVKLRRVVKEMKEVKEVNQAEAADELAWSECIWEKD